MNCITFTKINTIKKINSLDKKIEKSLTIKNKDLLMVMSIRLTKNKKKYKKKQ